MDLNYVVENTKKYPTERNYCFLIGYKEALRSQGLLTDDQEVLCLDGEQSYNDMCISNAALRKDLRAMLFIVLDEFPSDDDRHVDALNILKARFPEEINNI